ncbi:ABC transporter substrate-binding protein [Microbaculum marinisediminis]|uniref:ABC transporter substrate-binding protein n=1 Tax=Microbaculum marinisediminis TaxID=2931392 RepID=A0AAW5QZZ8_9HYPH|nr:ABC transporter substrate-binding protein [Microbaculum sp. A6E488]MCT8973590.1 ABC transporter substrate-binding protein [Microbaculum sp. A6E488]
MWKANAVVLVLAAGLAGFGTAQAQETVKIGVILPLTGPFADTGIQVDNGIKLYMKENGDTVAGKTVEIITKDVGGIAPDVAKRLATELVVRDKVDILAGFALTPNALAVGPISEEAKKFMVVMNAATSIITTKSPYMARVSMTTPMVNEVLGKWAYDNGVQEAYTINADYGPGNDAQSAFQRAFEAAGGKIVGADKTPVANPDFSAFVQRAKDANPQGIWVFIPGGAQPAALGKALAERGLTPQNTTIMGQGELTFEAALESMGDSAVGIITGFHYDYNHKSDMNAAFVKAYNAMFGRNPDIYSVGGYDGMHLIYAALEKTDGSTDGEALIDAAKGMAWESPRGPMSIDPETRDVIENIYIRRVEKGPNGKLINVEFDKVENVKDPVKARM